MASKKTQEELELTLQGDLPKAKKEKAKKAVRKSSKARKPVKKLSKMEKELITKAIPMVNEQDFIIAAMAYTMMSHDYSAMQNKVVTLMLEKLQSVLHTLITKNLPDITQLGSIQEGDIKNGTVMAGQIAGMIHDVKPCREIIQDIMKEFHDLARKAAAYE